MNRLVATGCVERKPGRGTFFKGVTEKAAIGMLFGPSLSAEPSYFFRALRRALESEMETRNWAARVYDGLDIGGVPAPSDATVCRHLRTDCCTMLSEG